ncbi:unnamed protein product [Ambrosiozyma monospora]|uniref:Unnamed protein product n=1 Tax=Ambrosiozyma monospora TaxID=43982 RepID=A0ACB5TCH6_AMBMO|nr:unnamed protein product [Ambrosiozyma monospora]
MATSIISTAELKALVLDGNKHQMIADNDYLSQIKPIEDALPAIDPSIRFDPSIHLAFKPEHLKTCKRKTMEELGAACPEQISEVGVSEPFPLFTDEAVEIMRSELLRKEVFDEYGRLSYNSTTGLGAMIRGYAKDAAPFTYAAWTHPVTVSAVSAMAGVELEPIMDYEVASVNVAMKSPDAAQNELVSSRRRSSLGNKFDDDVPAVVGWHNDSYPFVCVLMLSDTSKMIGGETLIKPPSGEIIPAEGPAKGKATVLQGRILNHLASIPIVF